MEIARMVTHPTDDQVTIIRIGPHLANTMGGFTKARYSQDHHGYLLHTRYINALRRHLTNNDIHLLDDRTPNTIPGIQPANPLPECIYCGQPASRNNPPTHCPDCGNPWTPATISGKCQCGQEHCPINNPITIDEQVRINIAGMAKVRAALAAAGHPTIPPQPIPD